MVNISKMAKKDAERYAAAEMFYGAGAGTRRKLLGAELDEKMLRLADTDYTDLFHLEYELLDMNFFAKQAIKERKSIARAAKASKNFRAIKNGNVQNLSTGLFIAAGIYMVAKQTGYDKVVEAKVEELWKKARTEFKYRKARAQGRNVSKIA